MRLKSLLLIPAVHSENNESRWRTPANHGENRNVIVEMIKWKVILHVLRYLAQLRLCLEVTALFGVPQLQYLVQVEVSENV